ncbi:MAG: type IV toxin-antitoxin system AbiEi family antitoxin domain-containing protein [Chloroflexota bacterium]|nr:type IV toxin-antitoxin system AbiEi family antitoxin domain-containing protein [Chloroflexota bacterium]
MDEQGYAQSQGMMLLSRVVEQAGPLFTVEEARATGAALKIAPERVPALLSQLAQAGWIERLKRGSYAVTTPLFNTTLHPYAVAAALVSPVAISHWSALAHHGFTTQIPPMVQASTTASVVTPEMRQGAAYRPRGRAAWRALGLEFEFIQVKPEHFFGFEREWVSQWHRVAITDPERTVLDTFAAPQIFGSLQTGLETLEAQLHGLDLDRLVAYALRYEVGAVIKRLGWALEQLAAPESAVEPLKAYPVSAYSPLDPTRPPGGTPVTGWQLRDNLRPTEHHATR